MTAVTSLSRQQVGELQEWQGHADGGEGQARHKGRDLSLEDNWLQTGLAAMQRESAGRE